jgi:hypothetical protein
VLKDSSSIRRIAMAFPVLQLLDTATSSSSLRVDDQPVPGPSLEARLLKRHQSVSSSEPASADPYQVVAVDRDQQGVVAPLPSTQLASTSGSCSEALEEARAFLNRDRPLVKDSHQKLTVEFGHTHGLSYAMIFNFVLAPPLPRGVPGEAGCKAPSLPETRGRTRVSSSPVGLWEGGGRFEGYFGPKHS